MHGGLPLVRISSEFGFIMKTPSMAVIVGDGREAFFLSPLPEPSPP
jgi:hypothetical protein